MLKLDSHNHVGETQDVTRQYIKDYDKYGIERGVWAGFTGNMSNRNVAKAMQEYPGRIIGFAYIDLDTEVPDAIDGWAEKGFTGVKVIMTDKRYDHEDYLKFYERARSLDLPVLFHTGYLSGENKPVRIDNYRPVHLDTIARHFPTLRMSLAHLGNPWWEEAYLAIVKNENIFCDLTGLSLRLRPMSLVKNLFFRDGKSDEKALSKVMFGTDMEIGPMVAYHEKFAKALRLPAGIRKKIYSETFLEHFWKKGGAFS